MNRFKPAFPFVVDENQFNTGLSVRDYIAIQAMNGLISRRMIDPKNDSKLCYEIADAMIKESENGL